MSYENPGLLDVLVENVVYHTFGTFYRSFLDKADIRGGERILEFGSGGGTCSVHILKQLQGSGTLTCVDISEFWTNKAKRRLMKHPNVEFRVGDIRRMPFDPGSFDIVLVHLVLHDVPRGDRQAVVDVLAHTLTGSGMFCIREPTKESHGMPVSEIRTLLENAGLEEKEFRFSSSFYIGPFYEGVYSPGLD